MPRMRKKPPPPPGPQLSFMVTGLYSLSFGWRVPLRPLRDGGGELGGRGVAARRSCRSTATHKDRAPHTVLVGVVLSRYEQSLNLRLQLAEMLCVEVYPYPNRARLYGHRRGLSHVPRVLAREGRRSACHPKRRACQSRRLVDLGDGSKALSSGQSRGSPCVPIDDRLAGHPAPATRT